MIIFTLLAAFPLCLSSCKKWLSTLCGVKLVCNLYVQFRKWLSIVKSLHSISKIWNIKGFPHEQVQLLSNVHCFVLVICCCIFAHGSWIFCDIHSFIFYLALRAKRFLYVCFQFIIWLSQFSKFWKVLQFIKSYPEN